MQSKNYFHFVDDIFIDMGEFKDYLPIIELDGRLVVSARNLCSFTDGWTGVTSFPEWFIDQIDKHSFIEGLDYVPFAHECKVYSEEYNKVYTDYALSSNMAKIIAANDECPTSVEICRYLSIQEKEFRDGQKKQELPSTFKLRNFVVNSLEELAEQSDNVIKKPYVKKHEKADSPWD